MANTITCKWAKILNLWKVSSKYAEWFWVSFFCHYKCFVRQYILILSKQILTLLLHVMLIVTVRRKFRGLVFLSSFLSFWDAITDCVLSSFQAWSSLVARSSHLALESAVCAGMPAGMPVCPLFGQAAGSALSSASESCFYIQQCYITSSWLCISSGALLCYSFRYVQWTRRVSIDNPAKPVKPVSWPASLSRPVYRGLPWCCVLNGIVVELSPEIQFKVVHIYWH